MSTSASARRVMYQQPIGAGGFAAHTVGPAHISQVVGGAGLNTETNPIHYHNENGDSRAFPTDGTYRPHQFQVVESFRRNPDNYVNTSFRLAFSKPMKHVRAIELMELNVPNVVTTIPANREFLLLLGLSDPTSGQFQPQDNLYQKSPYKTMLSDDHHDPNVDRTTNPAWTNAMSMELSDYALFRGHYDVSQPLQWWDNLSYKRIMYFPTPIPSLATLELTLMDPLGNLYDMNPAHEWSAVLQIHAKQ